MKYHRAQGFAEIPRTGNLLEVCNRIRRAALIASGVSLSIEERSSIRDFLLGRLGPLQQISRLFEHPGAKRVQARRLSRAVEQLGTQCRLQPLQLPGNRRGRPEWTIGCTGDGPGMGGLYEGA